MLLIRIIGVWVCVMATTCVKAQSQRYVFEHPQMGTVFRIVLYHADSLQAQEAAEIAWQRIDLLNDQMSDYLAESELNALSSTSGDRFLCAGQS